MKQISNDIISKESQDISLGDITSPMIIKFAGKINKNNNEIDVELVKLVSEFLEKYYKNYLYKLDNKIFFILNKINKNLDVEALKRLSKLLLVNILAYFVLNITKKIQNDHNYNRENTIELYLKNYFDYSSLIDVTKQNIKLLINNMLIEL